MKILDTLAHVKIKRVKMCSYAILTIMWYMIIRPKIIYRENLSHEIFCTRNIFTIYGICRTFLLSIL